MTKEQEHELRAFKRHPWHGISLNGHGDQGVVNVYIELVPSDTIKYELDKESGHLKADRAQQFSNICPTPYGMIPQTYCGKRVGDFCAQKTGREEINGDGDPLDICVFSEKIIPHGDIVVHAKPIGGLRMIDNGEADDKIIAVLNKDLIFGKWDDITDCPKAEIDRIKHYFLTYKQDPDNPGLKCEITHVYGREEATEVINLANLDYKEKFGE